MLRQVARGRGAIPFRALRVGLGQERGHPLVEALAAVQLIYDPLERPTQFFDNGMASRLGLDDRLVTAVDVVEHEHNRILERSQRTAGRVRRMSPRAPVRSTITVSLSGDDDELRPGKHGDTHGAGR